MDILAISKDTVISMSDGALYSILAIAMVFSILLIIIGITTLIFKLTGLFDLKAELDKEKALRNAPKAEIPEARERGPVEIKDDDMMAAVLVATIDYRNEVKSDVRVVSVKEL